MMVVTMDRAISTSGYIHLERRAFQDSEKQYFVYGCALFQRCWTYQLARLQPGGKVRDTCTLLLLLMCVAGNTRSISRNNFVFHIIHPDCKEFQATGRTSFIRKASVTLAT
ncbi:hypothetical protein PTI98_005898 [Pleurotus ostreatus]|nr:hypothetical protein PTI98_005898 [Pleurotus ostreatus]